LSGWVETPFYLLPTARRLHAPHCPFFECSETIFPRLLSEAPYGADQAGIKKLFLGLLGLSDRFFAANSSFSYPFQLFPRDAGCPSQMFIQLSSFSRLRSIPLQPPFTTLLLLSPLYSGPGFSCLVSTRRLLLLFSFSYGFLRLDFPFDHLPPPGPTRSPIPGRPKPFVVGFRLFIVFLAAFCVSSIDPFYSLPP